MARRAVGRYDQPFLEKGLAMDALGEILKDMVLVDCPLRRDRRTLRVALSAHEGNL
jgi:hypothetical protein